MTTVHIPPQLRSMTGEISKIDASPGTVAEIIGRLDSSYPGIRSRLDDEIYSGYPEHRQSDEERLAIDAGRFVITVRGHDIQVQDGFNTRVAEGDDVTITPYAWYRVSGSAIAKSTRWRRCIDDLRAPDGSSPPPSLSKSAIHCDNPTEWLESLALDHEMALYATSKNRRWWTYVATSLGPPAKMKATSPSDYDPSDTLHLWLCAALGVDPIAPTHEREVQIMCTEWWLRVVREYASGNARSTAGPKDRKAEDE